MVPARPTPWAAGAAGEAAAAGPERVVLVDIQGFSRGQAAAPASLSAANLKAPALAFGVADVVLLHASPDEAVSGVGALDPVGARPEAPLHTQTPTPAPHSNPATDHRIVSCPTNPCARTHAPQKGMQSSSQAVKKQAGEIRFLFQCAQFSSLSLSSRPELKR